MLLVGADRQTSVQSRRWKINVSSFNTFHNMGNLNKVSYSYILVLSIPSSGAPLVFKVFSSQGERRGRVYPNATQVISVQTGSSGHDDGPARWASRPTAWPGAPWNAMKSESQNKAGFTATCRTISPSPCLCLSSFRLPPRVVTQEVHEDQGGGVSGPI